MTSTLAPFPEFVVTHWAGKHAFRRVCSFDQPEVDLGEKRRALVALRFNLRVERARAWLARYSNSDLLPTARARLVEIHGHVVVEWAENICREAPAPAFGVGELLRRSRGPLRAGVIPSAEDDYGEDSGPDSVCSDVEP
jgi:hypothetical protein